MNLEQWLQLRREGRLSAMPLGMQAAMAAFGDESEIANFSKEGDLYKNFYQDLVTSQHWTEDGHGNSHCRYDIHYDTGDGTGNGTEYGMDPPGVGGSEKGNGAGNGMEFISGHLLNQGNEDGDGEGNGLGSNSCKNFIYSCGHLIQFISTNIGSN